MVNREVPSLELSRQAARHCAPLLAGFRPDIWFEGSGAGQHSWGTVTLVKVGDRVLGITCHHVVQHAMASGCPGFMLGLEQHIPLDAPLVAHANSSDPDYPFDIAVFEIDGKDLQHTEVVPLLLDDLPADLEEGERVLAVGFPRYGRVADENSMSRRCYYLSVTCHCASDRRIVLLEEEVPGQEKDFSVGGMSGGPIFKVNSTETYSLAGIIFEGRASGDVVEGGGSGESLWISGFPLSGRFLKDFVQARSTAHNTAPPADGYAAR